MAIPTRSKQIEVVADKLAWFLDCEDGETSVDDVAKMIVDGIYDMWTRDITSAPFPLVVGKAFKTPLVAKIYHVAWIGEAWVNDQLKPMAWVVTADSSYGTLAPYDSPFWRIVIESKDSRKDQSTPRPGAPGVSLAGWKVGDKVSHSQGAFKYEILAVADKANLLRRIGVDDVQAEPSSNLERYYRREKK